jgi:hypothetical protein
MRVRHDRVLALPLDLRGCWRVPWLILRSPFNGKCNFLPPELRVSRRSTLTGVLTCAPVSRWRVIHANCCQGRIIKMPFAPTNPEKFLLDAIELNVPIKKICI